MTPEEKEKYIQELEQLVTARTEQLRTALVTQERVKAVLIEAQTARSLTDAKSAIDRAFAELGRLGMCATENNQPPQFGGAPGTPVPQVDLDDIKASLQLAREVEKRHPDGRCQIGASLAASVCKPGADVPAIGYRLGQLGLIQIMAKLGSITQDTLGTLMRDGEFTEQTLRTIATIPMEWMGVGIVRQGPPYDFEEFLRLAA
jgi:hypothetical protein